MPRRAQLSQIIAVEVVGPLTRTEKGRLTHLEVIIKEGLDGFRKVGEALLEIRDSRLYRFEYISFDEYCRNRWNMGRSNANRTIQAAEILSGMAALPSPPTIMPETVKSTLPLAKVPKADRGKVFQEAIDEAGGDQPASKQVEEAAKKHAAPPKAPSPPIEPKPDPDSLQALKDAGIVPAEIQEVKVEHVGDERERQPGDDDEPIEPFEPKPETDEEFLDSLPARAKLKGAVRIKFDCESLAYRSTTELRQKYAADFRKLINKALKPRRGVLGPWTVMQVNIAKSKHPKQWAACEECDGTGKITTLGGHECGACWGEGFVVHIKRSV